MDELTKPHVQASYARFNKIAKKEEIDADPLFLAALQAMGGRTIVWEPKHVNMPRPLRSGFCPPPG